MPLHSVSYKSNKGIRLT